MTDYAPLARKGVVAIDPNLSDLIHCVNTNAPDQVKFHYTKDQRRRETKVKKYRD